MKLYFFLKKIKHKIDTSFVTTWINRASWDRRYVMIVVSPLSKFSSTQLDQTSTPKISPNFFLWFYTSLIVKRPSALVHGSNLIFFNINRDIWSLFESRQNFIVFLLTIFYALWIFRAPSSLSTRWDFCISWNSLCRSSSISSNFSFPWNYHKWSNNYYLKVYSKTCLQCNEIQYSLTRLFYPRDFGFWILMLQNVLSKAN